MNVGILLYRDNAKQAIKNSYTSHIKITIVSIYIDNHIYVYAQITFK